MTFYDAGLGRFGQRDAIRQDRWSAYVYANDAALRWTDPSGMWVSTVISCGLCHLCVKRAHTAGDHELQDYLGHPSYKGRQPDKSGKGGSEFNALGHCVSRCHARRKCGKVCSRAWETAYEGWLPISGRLQESIMDLHNNEKGYEVADAGGSCTEGCIEKWKNGKLFVLNPIKYRNYPYGK